MLTEERRQQITAEEIFRDEARRSLERQGLPRSRRERLWALLNSSFMLWLLSSVLVSGLTAVYTRYQIGEADRIRRQDTVRRLDTEIGNRIYHAGVALDVYRDNITRTSTTWTVSSIDTQVSSFLNNTIVNGNQDFSVFAEYRTRSFPSLIIELSSLVPPDEMADLQRALAGYQKLGKAGSDMTLNAPATREQQLDAVAQAATLLHVDLQQRRWRLTVYTN